MAVASPSPSPPSPRFTGLALSLLLPVFLLGVLATLALVRDWRAARTEAAARAQELALAAIEQTADRLLADPPDPTGLHGFAFAAEFGGFVIGVSNRLLDPPALAWPPSPEPLDTAPPTDERLRSFDAARRAFRAEAWTEVLEHLDALLRIDPNRPATLPVTDLHPRILGTALLERALAQEHLGRPDEAAQTLALALAEPALAATTTEAGVPLAHLAALRMLDLLPDHAVLPPGLRSRPRDPFAALLRPGPPSPYLDTFLERLRPRAATLRPDSPDSTAVTNLLATLERAERHRRLHAAALGEFGSSRDWPPLFWVAFADDAWLVIRRNQAEAPSPGRAEPLPSPAPPARGYATVPESALRRTLLAAVRELDRRGDFVVTLALAGRPWTATSRNAPPSEPGAPEPMAQASRAIVGPEPLVATVALADSRTFFASQRRRTLVFGGLVVAALLAAAVSVQATRRSLLRQHELNVQKTNFVSSVSHELRAPLGSIRLLAEGLERGTVPNEERRREYFRLISQETRRLGALVENVLDFSRIEQGRKRYEFEPTDLRALVSGTLRVFEPLALSRGVELLCRLPPEPAPCEIVADGRALQQAQLNLLDNALKHSPAGSRIVVELAAPETDTEPEPEPETPSRPRPETEAGPRRDPPTVRLSVSDQGPGIPAADHVRIFEPFFRRGSELRRDTQGIGIGLGIVKHIVEAHHGRVEVDSAPGSGARFTLVLPRSSFPPSPPLNP